VAQSHHTKGEIGKRDRRRKRDSRMSGQKKILGIAEIAFSRSRAVYLLGCRCGNLGSNQQRGGPTCFALFC
jgi:hypothetical protein